MCAELQLQVLLVLYSFKLFTYFYSMTRFTRVLHVIFVTFEISVISVSFFIFVLVKFTCTHVFAKKMFYLSGERYRSL